ncbi:SCO family protein [Paraflavitalea soli]|uniref:SCO family protein n=1 Tax=Paraflavitalea soli TaxID=2315862 RepID=A0A3B7MKL8_9BACT|nr:SCO family protein [Paraflavitalea soli]AXY74197.1 SCO family protein [Paraflavitalea soli]
MTPLSRIVTLLIVTVSIIGLFFFIGAGIVKKNSLPILGEPDHVAGSFSFTNQEGKTITEKDVTGKVTVVEYFFTTCPGICKIMNKNLTSVYQTFKGEPQFMILSHTVDPETDSVPVLAAYAKQLKAEAPAWEFLTGNKDELYKAARQEYLLAVEDARLSGTAEDFIHTEKVALLDGERRIRGFYDATDSLGIKQLIIDTRRLLK